MTFPWLHALFSARFAPPRPPERTGYDRRLDGVRGFAAWSVMFVHGFGFEGEHALSPLTTSNPWFGHLHVSRAAVLLFFVLSGYVIGLTNQEEFTATRGREYAARRVLRIVPIYLVAVLLGWAAWPAVAWSNVLANFFFLQNGAWGVLPLLGNLPLWSLHNEMLYYGLFVWVWAARPRVLPWAVLLVALSLADWFRGGWLSIPGGWATGLVFWLSGLLLAWNRRDDAAPARAVLGWVLVLFATNHLWPGRILLNGAGFPYAGTASLWFSDLALLPACVIVFCLVARLEIPGRKLVQGVALALPLGTALLLLAMRRLGENVPWTMSAAALLLALPLLRAETGAVGRRLFGWFEGLGTISYGVYLFHVPCLLVFRRFYPWSGTVPNYLAGVLGWMAMTFALAWACERRLQPWLLRVYRARRGAGEVRLGTPRSA